MVLLMTDDIKWCHAWNITSPPMRELSYLMLFYRVQAMLETQQRIRKHVDGFVFNLGFSGKYYHHGNPDENEGDDALLGL